MRLTDAHLLILNRIGRSSTQPAAIVCLAMSRHKPQAVERAQLTCQHKLLSSIFRACKIHNQQPVFAARRGQQDSAAEHLAHMQLHM